MLNISKYAVLTAALLFLCLGFPACGGNGNNNAGGNCGVMAPVVAGVPGSTPNGSLAAPEMAMVEEVFARVNAERMARGINPLSWDADAGNLFTATHDHTVYQMMIGMLTHDGPGGCTAPTDCLGNRLTTAGVVAPAERTSWGENVAQGQTTAAQVMTGWMNSAGHCNNILNPGFNRIAISVVNGAGGPYWTQVFITQP